MLLNFILVTLKELFLKKTIIVIFIGGVVGAAKHRKDIQPPAPHPQVFFEQNFHLKFFLAHFLP